MNSQPAATSAPAHACPGCSLAHELTHHVPFTAASSAAGVALVIALLHSPLPAAAYTRGFQTLHPLHVLLSAWATTAMYRRHGGRGWWRLLLVGYLGAVGIATLSDCVIPFAAEWLLQLPRRGLHLGFIEHAWLVNPLALAGIAAGAVRANTRFSHAGHVLLSTSASLLHVAMALGAPPGWRLAPLLVVFLFLAVWVPCCTSDIVFPMVCIRGGDGAAAGADPVERKLQ